MGRTISLSGREPFRRELSSSLSDILKKIEAKDVQTHSMIYRKMDEVVVCPERYKPLTGNLKGVRRVHIGTNNILTFTIDYQGKRVVFEDFGGYDQIYDS